MLDQVIPFVHFSILKFCSYFLCSLISVFRNSKLYNTLWCQSVLFALFVWNLLLSSLFIVDILRENLNKLVLRLKSCKKHTLFFCILGSCISCKEYVHRSCLLGSSARDLFPIDKYIARRAMISSTKYWIRFEIRNRKYHSWREHRNYI